MAAKRCPDKPASHDLEKWITECNTKINAAQTAPPKPKEPEVKKPQPTPQTPKTGETKKEEPKTEPKVETPKTDRTPCYWPLLSAAQASFYSKNFSDAKDLYNEARKCHDLVPDNELALWIKMCDDELVFQNNIKTNYTPYYNKGIDLFKKGSYEKAKENFLIAKQSEYKPDNSDLEEKIKECNIKINEQKYNTLHHDTLSFTFWGREAFFTGGVQYNKPNGKGILVFSKDYYIKSIEGSFKNGEPVGTIRCVFSNQDEFKGTVRGEDFSLGEYKFASGDIYTGTFYQRVPNGEGEIIYANGDTYTGYVVNGKRGGEGKLVAKPGTYITNAQGASVYEGNWSANQKSGLGRCYDDKNELIHEGIFTSDFPEQNYPNRLMRIAFTWVKVPEGNFTMGCTSGRDCTEKDRPSHFVYLSEFQISNKEVTVAQYRTFCEATGRSMPPKPSWGWEDDNPIVNVSWNDAVAFCLWTNCRLPTEAEWEYAAQGAIEPRQKLYSGGNDLREVAYYKDNSTRTRPVGKKKPNELFLYDMSGNVSEWVQDWFAVYPQYKQQDPPGPSFGTHKVVRGGNWRSDEVECRITNRGACEPNLCTNYIGFRVVRNW